MSLQRNDGRTELRLRGGAPGVQHRTTTQSHDSSDRWACVLNTPCSEGVTIDIGTALTRYCAVSIFLRRGGLDVFPANTRADISGANRSHTLALF